MIVPENIAGVIFISLWLWAIIVSIYPTAQLWYIQASVINQSQLHLL